MSGVENINDQVVIQRWMWRLILWFLTILGGGAIGTIVITVNWVFLLQSDVSDIKSQVAAAKVKEADFNNVINDVKTRIDVGIASLRTDVQQLQRTVDVMKAREGITNPNPK